MPGTITRAELAASILDALETTFGPPPAAAVSAWEGASEAIANGILDAFTSEIDDGDYLQRDGTDLVGDPGGGGGGVTDHGALTGLEDDDHPQYATDADLTSAVATLLAFINSHGSNHLPSGSDPLTTAAPVAIGGALSAGSANSFARSDHVHTIPDSIVSRTFYEVDFSSLANNTLTNGTEVIDGLSYTAANMGSLGLADVSNGNGIRMNAGTSLGTAATFTSASQNAPNLQVPLSSIPNWDGRYDIIIEMYLTWTLEISSDAAFVGLYCPGTNTPAPSSIARCRLARISQNSGVRNLSTMATAVLTNANVATTGQVLSIRVRAQGDGHASIGSTYSGGWPIVDTQLAFSADTGVLSPFNWSGVSLVFGVCVNNDSSPTTAVTFRRMRCMRC